MLGKLGMRFIISKCQGWPWMFMSQSAECNASPTYSSSLPDWCTCLTSHPWTAAGWSIALCGHWHIAEKKISELINTLTYSTILNCYLLPSSKQKQNKKQTKKPPSNRFILPPSHSPNSQKATSSAVQQTASKIPDSCNIHNTETHRLRQYKIILHSDQY